jgi:hypothetical protein
LSGPQGAVGVGKGTVNANGFAVPVERAGAGHTAAVELPADLHRVVVALAHEPDGRRAGNGRDLGHWVLDRLLDLRLIRSGPNASRA